MQARPPYESGTKAAAWAQRAAPADDEFDERAAFEAARLEQQREPVDLIGRAA